MNEISQLSVMSMRIELTFRDVSLGHGTGTVWKSGTRYQLLTNWHVLAGKNPSTGQALDPTGALPDKAVIWWTNAANNSQWISGEILLRGGDGLPLWRVHPVLGNKIDLATMDIEPPAGAMAYCVNTMIFTPIRRSVGADAFVIGYPYGRDQGMFPVWKRGSLATEPMLSVAGRPYHLIDTASRPGMSGSPIYLYERNGYSDEAGNFALNTQPVHRFIGVYSGRLSSKSALDLELGMYWPNAFCDQILAYGIPDPDV